MKIIALSLILVLFASACSHKTESTVTRADTPQFSIAASDIVSTSVKAVTGSVPSSPTQVVTMVQVELSSAKAAEFRQFTKDHVNQKIQILVGTNVVYAPGIAAETDSPQVSPKMDLVYFSKDEAHSDADLLS